MIKTAFDNGRARAYAALIAANLLYASSYAATRLALRGVPPAALAFLRLLIGGLLLLPLLRGGKEKAPVSARDHWLIAGMGVLGFGAAFWLANWGIAKATATDAALLIVVEPVSLMLLGPLLLGERLSPREALGAALAVAGSLLVILNGLPGLSPRLLPHWRGDLLLVLSGVAYASYSLMGRPVLARHDEGRVTVWSLFWGAAAMLPLTIQEWSAGARPAFSRPALLWTLYLAVVVTALSFWLWNWALRRVEAARAAVFLNIQPVVGAFLGFALLGERLSAFALCGGALIVAGLAAAFY